ncbi:MAG TPA: hypothetical protein VM183_02040 [Burkholderiales bacterium]|nr:hypothetical protein [Burkholderiales bacterium]
MKFIRAFLLLSLIAGSASARAAVEEEQDWAAFGHVLTLVQQMVRIGAHPYPDQAMAELLAGRNHQANQAVASLFAGATAEMPPEYRDRVAALGRDFASLAMKHPAPAAVETISTDRSLQARKDLNSMGLRYFDESQYLDAVKRNDQLAVELFIAARGVNLDAKSWSGRSALEIARDNGNTQLAELLSRSLPAKR